MVDLRCCQRELGHEMKQVSGGVHLQTASRGETANCWCNLPFPPGPIARRKEAGTHGRASDRLLFAQRVKHIFRIFLLLVGILSLKKVVICMRQQLDLSVRPLGLVSRSKQKSISKTWDLKRTLKSIKSKHAM